MAEIQVRGCDDQDTIVSSMSVLGCPGLLPAAAADTMQRVPAADELSLLLASHLQCLALTSSPAVACLLLLASHLQWCACASCLWWPGCSWHAGLLAAAGIILPMAETMAAAGNWQMLPAMVCSSCWVTFQQSYVAQGSTSTQLPAVTRVITFNKFEGQVSPSCLTQEQWSSTHLLILLSAGSNNGDPQLVVLHITATDVLLQDERATFQLAVGSVAA